VQAVLQRLRPPSGFGDALAEARHLALLKPTTLAEQRLFEQLSSQRMLYEVQARPSGHEQDGATVGALVDDGLQGRSRYTPIPATVRDVVASKVTSANLDKSDLLSRLFLQQKASHSLLGELQFAFVSFLVGKSLEGMLILPCLIPRVQLASTSW
jgi:hypothetical protein